MTAIPHAHLSRREAFVLGAIFTAPFLLYAVIRVFGFMKYAQLAALAGIVLAAATTLLLRPRWGLWFIVFYVYAGLSFYMPFVLAGFATVVVSAAVVLELLLGGTNRLKDVLFWYAVAIFFLIAVGSMLWADEWKLSVYELSNYIKMVVLTYLIVQLVRTPEQLRMLMYVVLAGGLATVFLGLINLALGLQSVGDNYIRGSTYMLRFMGTHENPNRAAAYMCTALPMAIFALRNGRKWTRPFSIAAILVLVAAIFATFSRSVAFPLSFIGLAVMIREVRGKRGYIAIAMVVAIAAALTPKVYWERVLGLGEAFETTTLDWSVYTRLLALKTAWEMFLDHPFTGIGIGNFITSAAYKLFVRIVVHNTYLEVLVGTGIFGLLAFLTIIYAGFRHTVRGALARWEGQPAWVRSACFYCALSAISIWMSSFFGTMPFRHGFWVPIATGLVIGNLLQGPKPVRS